MLEEIAVAYALEAGLFLATENHTKSWNRELGTYNQHQRQQAFALTRLHRWVHTYFPLGRRHGMKWGVFFNHVCHPKFWSLAKKLTTAHHVLCLRKVRATISMGIYFHHNMCQPGNNLDDESWVVRIMSCFDHLSHGHCKQGNLPVSQAHTVLCEARKLGQVGHHSVLRRKCFEWIMWRLPMPEQVNLTSTMSLNSLQYSFCARIMAQTITCLIETSFPFLTSMLPGVASGLIIQAHRIAISQAHCNTQLASINPQSLHELSRSQTRPERKWTLYE